MRIQLIETAQTTGTVLSIGAFFVKHGMEQAGHQVDVQRFPVAGYDIEMISAHHVTDYKAIVAMPKRSPVRIIGGHALYTNPRPLIPFADFLCLGEWDTGLSDLARIGSHPSVITCNAWETGRQLPPYRVAQPLPPFVPYLNHAGTNSAAYYIEIARGCPFRCAYCEIGHSVPYRRRTLAEIQTAIEACDLSVTRKINLFAPDEASHPDYDAILEHIQERGAFPSGFASVRVDTVRKLTHIRKNTLIRCGIDGLTEETRQRVGKHITDRMIIEYFKQQLAEGHTNFKLFMMVGYEWERLRDFDQFTSLMSRVFRLDIQKNIALRIKWTPLIPQPNTPLAQTTAQYDPAMVAQIERWHMLHAKPTRTPGWYVENDGIMSQRTHQEQCALNVAQEDYFYEFSSHVSA